MDYNDAFNSNNPLAQDSFLGSKYLDPGYLFSRLAEIANYVFDHFFTRQALEILYAVFSLFALFFISVIVYTTIRMFEIRKKEHMHLQHELEEYAHKQALKEMSRREDSSEQEEKALS